LCHREGGVDTRRCRSAPRIIAPVEQVERKIAVMFADVSGSTQLYERLGDAQALATTSACLNMARGAAGECGGRLVKTIGDEVMLTFAAPAQAAEAAVRIHETLPDVQDAADLRLAFRVGFHFGEAIERDGDVFGDSVNTAARLVGLAKPGQILTSSSTGAMLRGHATIRLRDLAAITVKGKQEDLGVVELLWQSAADLTMIGRRPAPQVTRIELRHGDTAIGLDARTLAVTLGRDERSDVVVRNMRASRLHARIERRGDKFAVVDTSVNGTYVTFEGEREFVLHRQECLLKGRGLISLGQSHESDPAGSVSFACAES
jgi:class 3 adenylate cyclase